MKLRILGIGLLVGGVAAFGLLTRPLSGQQAPAAGAPRTPWGAPDLRGLWNGTTITPLERPRNQTKEFLTAEEARAIEERAAQRNQEESTPDAGDPGTYNQIWFDPGSKLVPSRRTSLIIDPPDGRIPFKPEGLEHFRASSAHYGKGPRDSWTDFDTGERCLTDGPPIYFSGYNNNYQIFQTPDYVAILAEMFGDRRIIPLDGRPAANIPQWLGNSRGRWEGDTLVIETTGYADKAGYWWANAWRASRPTLKMTERLKRVDAKTLEYQFTMEDPAMFTRPWTATFPLTTDQAAHGVTAGRMYEYACHEGNYAMENTLKGAKLQRESGGRGTR